MTEDKKDLGAEDVNLTGDTEATEKAVKKSDMPAVEQPPVLTDEDEDILSAVWDEVG